MSLTSPENLSGIPEGIADGTDLDRRTDPLRDASRTKTLDRRASLAAAVLLGLGLIISSLPIFQQSQSAYGAEHSPTSTPTTTSTLTPEVKRIIAALENPYYWVNKVGVNKEDTIFHGTDGFGSNNPLRAIDTIRQCDFNTQTQTRTNCINFQPDERLFPETQTSTDVRLVVYGIRVRNFNNTDVGFAAMSVPNYPDDTNVHFPRTLRIGDMDRVTDNSQQIEDHQGLPQGGSWGGTYNSISIPGNELQVGITNSLNSADNGTYSAPLDSNGNISGSFTQEPTQTPTPTTGTTPTIKPIATFNPDRKLNTRWHMPVVSTNPPP